MKNIIVTISVSGIVFILILVGALIFQKMNMADSIKNVDNALNKEINSIESSLLKNGQGQPKATPPAAEQTPDTQPLEQVTPQTSEEEQPSTTPAAEQAPAVPAPEQAAPQAPAQEQPATTPATPEAAAQ